MTSIERVVIAKLAFASELALAEGNTEDFVQALRDENRENTIVEFLEEIVQKVREED